MGNLKPLYGKSVKFYEREIEKAEAVIAEKKEVIKICKEELEKAKNENKN